MYRYTYIFYFFCILISCSSDTKVDPQDENEISDAFKPQKVLFIGNSHTYFNQGVDFHLQEFALQGNLSFEPQIEKIAFGGYTLEQHLENELTLKMINEQEWDIVVLQENTFRAANEMEAALVAIPEFKAKLTANTKVFLFMTWAYEEEPNMLSTLKQTYERAATVIDGTIVPVGIAFDQAQEDISSTISLYNQDGVHPSPEGTFLAAGMFYRAIYEQNPVLNSYNAGFTLATATYLKELAKTSYENYAP